MGGLQCGAVSSGHTRTGRTVRNVYDRKLKIAKKKAGENCTSPSRVIFAPDGMNLVSQLGYVAPSVRVSVCLAASLCCGVVHKCLCLVNAFAF